MTEPELVPEIDLTGEDLPQNTQVADLEAKIADLTANAELDAKTKRRKIRKLKEKIAALVEEPEPDDGDDDPEPEPGDGEPPAKKKRKKRIIGRVSKPVGPEFMAKYRDDVDQEMAAAGLTLGDLATHHYYGFSLKIAYDKDVSGEQFLEKFKARWPDVTPQFYGFTNQGDDILLLIGPTPSPSDPSRFA